ncbi:MAG: hypothetical protein IKW96_05285 [Ruminococcus sp.]|uniref:hypothetical protein n=1 Tax=Ruminococcus sp. TaxID=41978 RepID=UPI0025FB0743|nr:hypothetical protein [Ruminococcus sp.]MBR5682682.1 hypothetical protein [Ruminococcus sp.]
MKNTRILAALLAAAAVTSCLTGCGDKKKSSMPLYAETPASNQAEGYNSADYASKLAEQVNAAEVSEGDLDLGSVNGELVSPEEGAADYKLGDYRVSSSGVKLYYDEAEFPQELVLTFEKYFESLQNGDYSTYYKTLFPEYVTEMEATLTAKEGHTLKDSFVNQCTRVADITQGDFKVTRIKLEKPVPREDGQDDAQSYFDMLNGYFEKDYYSVAREQSENLIPAIFYVMGETSQGQEIVILHDCKIVFAVKEGKYYTFG